MTPPSKPRCPAGCRGASVVMQPATAANPAGAGFLSDPPAGDKLLAMRQIRHCFHPLPAILVTLALLVVPGARAGADLLLAVKAHTNGMKIGNRVQEPHDAQAKIWLASDRMRRDEGTTSVIVRLDRKKIYLISHTDRTYSEVAIPIDWSTVVPPRDQDSFQRYIADNQIKATFAPSTETRQIRTWSTTRVNLELTNQHGLRMAAHWWLTKDIPLYSAYNQMNAALASLQPNAADWAQKEGRLDGFPVYQETTIYIGDASSKSVEELVSADSREVPAGTYDVPAGFRAMPFDPFRQPTQ
jgi:hypothetical protein